MEALLAKHRATAQARITASVTSKSARTNEVAVITKKLESIDVVEEKLIPAHATNNISVTDSMEGVILTPSLKPVIAASSTRTLETPPKPKAVSFATQQNAGAANAKPFVNSERHQRRAETVARTLRELTDVQEDAVSTTNILIEEADKSLDHSSSVIVTEHLTIEDTAPKTHEVEHSYSAVLKSLLSLDEPFKRNDQQRLRSQRTPNSYNDKASSRLKNVQMNPLLDKDVTETPLLDHKINKGPHQLILSPPRSPTRSQSPKRKAEKILQSPTKRTREDSPPDRKSAVPEQNRRSVTSAVRKWEPVADADIATAPLFTQAAGGAIEIQPDSDQLPKHKHYGVLGTISQEETSRSVADQVLYSNGNSPWSAFICGVQGAGKSHTLACLLENALIPHPTINHLTKPLAAIVFHYDQFTGEESTSICEAAYLCSKGMPVRVLASPSNFEVMKRLYANMKLPKGAKRPEVHPLYIPEQHLNIARMMSLMAVSPTGPTPLYVEVVTTILKEMAMENQGQQSFSYAAFKARLDATQWIRGQNVPLNMRLQVLETFLEPKGKAKNKCPPASKKNIWTFGAGALTIIDLSDPFLTQNDICSLFSMCLSIFMETRADVGRIIALDEAHQFLTQSGEAAKLTDKLVSIIRQQRHLGARVIVSTQEPTLSPTLIELCNVTIVHRFDSPAWFDKLKYHLAGAHNTAYAEEMFEQIVGLGMGRALVFCPMALVACEDQAGKPNIALLGNRYFKVKIRARLTVDGGQSVMIEGM